MIHEYVFTALNFIRNLQMSQYARVLHYTRQERLATEKHSSLLGPFKGYKETKIFYVFTTLNFIHNPQMGPKARVLHYTRQERLATEKHSSLLDPFISYKENKVF
jgi:hypothetical protein